MSKIAHVVEGEASESDSEVDMAKSPDTDENMVKSCVIAGEAPESDDETELKPQTEEPSPIKTTIEQHTPNEIVYNSLLHQKLWECNVSLRATIEGLVKHTVDISVDKLTRADKSLLTVQESMRATNANLTLARTRLKQIHAELEKANCSSALPNVKINP